MGQAQSAEDLRLARVRTHLKTVKLICPRDVASHLDVYHKFTEADYPTDDEKFVDLSTNSYMSKIQNQFFYGSCTAFAVLYMIEYDMRKQGQTPKDLSRLFLYYNSRKLQHTENEDSGASLRVVIYSGNHDGFCESEYWPYATSGLYSKPTQHCYELAGYSKSVEYRRIIPDLNHIRTALKKGYPVCIGVEVYDSFMSDETARTGIIPIPNKHKEKLLGGHATLLVGYDDDKKLFKFANSWSEDWGAMGFGFYHYDYVISDVYGLTYDYWTVTLLSPGTEPCPDTAGPSLTDDEGKSGSGAASPAIAIPVASAESFQ